MKGDSERRCPACGGLVVAEAEWCGQCFSSLSPTSSTPAEAGEGSAPVRAREGDPAWPCPVCDSRNPIELQYCAACGTPFGKGYEGLPARSLVDSQTALGWSLVLPGLGHLKVGRGLDGLARAVLFLWTAGTAVILLASRASKGIGSAGPLLGLFLLAAGGVYVVSALDAHRLASGRTELLGSRALLWGCVILVFISILLATVVTVQAARSR